ncbi:MAG: hypothetical protein SOY06_03360 [Prevotella sp.]|nr:hypothetical protein [Bacteroidales bacterium]MDY4228869.1 hypothetical protein [Prevotella sp.]
MMIKSLLKISLFVKRVLFLAVLGQFCFSAQAQGVVSKWKGVDPSNLNPTFTVYLFNVGTGKFVIHGNRWGTQATLRFPDLGTGFKVTNNGNTYLFDSEISNSEGHQTGNYLSLVLKGYGTNSGDRSDWGYYMDRNDEYRFTLTRVEGTADNMYVYKLSQTLGSTTYYMTANDDGTTIDYSTTEPTGADGYWVLVTKQALIENLKEGLLADAFGQLNADATYLLGDQNFSINNTDFNKWKQVSTGGTGTDYRYDWRNSAATNDSWNKLVVTKEWGGDNATNAMYSNVSIEGQGLFAYSDITAPATGWYVIQCQGFYAGENPAYMYAKVVKNDMVDSTAVKLQDASSSFTLETSGSIQTRNASKGLKAGKAFYENSSSYLNQLYFYAQTDDNITIGISKPGATKSNEDYTSNSFNYYHDLDYVAVDNFQLKFFGVSPIVFIDNEDNLDYLNNQNSVKKMETNASTMLKRNMTLGEWNTLVLPVNMSSAQLKTAFGDSPNMVQLAKLTALTGTVLEFTSVNLSEDNPQALKAGGIYIIKPQQSPVANSVTVNRADGTAVTVDGPFYNIGRHSYEDLKPLALSVTVSSPVGVMTAHGTYVNTKCPSGSYVLSHGDMYHIKTETPVKGFRCWFTFDDNAPKNVSLAIDGVAEGAIPTGLEDLVDTRLQPSDIYNANGQLVRRGATTLDGLPKGVYIVNGKKIAVQ